MTDKQQLDAELTEILKHLPGWRLDPKYADHCWCAVLIDDTGKGIHVNATQAKGRLYLSGMWPSDSDRQYCRPDKCQHITVARDRPPEKIAAEIQRRFLPWYTTAYAEEAERVKQHNASRNRQQEVAAELAALLGSEATRPQGNRTRIYAKGLTVEVHGNADVSIELSYTTIKIAKALLKAFVKAGGLLESA
jgi:hypothetical protein